MNDIVLRFVNLPVSIGGYTILDSDGDYNIFINSRMSFEKQLKTYKHELTHIDNGDFYRKETADVIEKEFLQEG